MRNATISIPQPCTQSWAGMIPNTAGRHCAACQETVADFTQMADSEVVAFLSQYPTISCGLFRESQLNRSLLAAAQPVTGWRRWLGAMVALLGIGSLLAPKAQAQAGQSSYAGGPEPFSTTNHAGVQSEKATSTEAGKSKAARAAGRTSAKPLQAAPDHVLIQGVVRNRWGLRQAGARVHLSPHPSAPILTDERGRFQLLVLENTIHEGSTLLVRYSNYDKDQYLMTRVPFDSARVRPYHIRLKKQQRVVGGKFR